MRQLVILSTAVQDRSIELATLLCIIRGLILLTHPHRDLNSDSHKRFGTRDYASWAYILDYGESNKGCLNYFRNRSAHIFKGDYVKYKR